TILDHVQRGGSPTLRDRVVATQMGYYAVELLEKGIGNRVVGLKGEKVVDYDILEGLNMKKPIDPKMLEMAKVIAL
ncbi:MAG: ATP-dependent 6-phosphofructokinase, partial [Oscillospiraceae bacterium]|nr:ATP-dependent 6-phosphofructokinase [Oscillospiraceae bacterium]